MKPNKCADCKVLPTFGAKPTSDMFFWFTCPKCSKKRGSIWGRDEAIKAWNQSNPKSSAANAATD